MPSPLIIALLLVVTLTGCATQPLVILEAPDKVHTCECSKLQKWLQLQRKVSAMRTEKIESILASMGEPEGRLQLFYFALLNQQLDVYTSWTLARDTFRQLSEDVTLSRGQRDFAGVLQRYNQSRINWYLRNRQLIEDHETLKAKLRASQEENQLMEQKIQAITDVETSISTRKEQ